MLRHDTVLACQAQKENVRLVELQGKRFGETPKVAPETGRATRGMQPTRLPLQSL